MEQVIPLRKAICS